MCGITGYRGTADTVEKLVAGLENLEYRGYDSAGIAVSNGDGVEVVKREGEIPNLERDLTGLTADGLGIGHTRWSTHGPPTDTNAHPHSDCTGTVAVVHNGIIENYDVLKKRLATTHNFTSDTDTEVIPHLIEDELAAGRSPEEAFRAAVSELSGSFAIAAIIDGTDAIFAARKGSPLVLGLNDSEVYLASDVPAFLDFTEEVVYLEDGDIVVVDADGWEVTDADGHHQVRQSKRIEWTAEDAQRRGYDHYMLKEIHEQPASLDQTLRGRISADDDIALDEFPEGAFSDVSRVQFVACGTSYHAAMYATQLFHKWGIPATTYRAGEYSTSPAPMEEDTLVIGVTQSGETADTLESLRRAKEAGARTLAVTNVVGSTAARECDDTIFIRAGPEIGVAATKTFSSQVTTLALLARLIAEQHEVDWAEQKDFVQALRSLPEDAKTVLNDTRVGDIVQQYADKQSYFFIGRGLGYPVALEGALKFKEITYEHAEGFAAGQLKHGPLALVSSDTPVFVVFTGENTAKTLQNVAEVQARGAPVIGIAGDVEDRVANHVDEFLHYPDTHPIAAGILANLHLQRVSYHVADRLDRAIDKPRNLAKSVTVE
ncbi:glutamine--fructose-6-phosphate transaminase (isomerizing) [Haloarchaeobius sp. DFWS5]|uniref:glutamine--fructose-6-phosphate transaminase (isomerizing) n=1 Tax=Haloarchaeobius sp. DFWS5 TaxID=3446114 RepID=UPI003EBAAA38